MIKRMFDLALTIPAVLILAPLMLLIAGVIRLTMGKKVFFCQMRPGFQGKPFVMYKFRTMSDACDQEGHLLPDAERLTGFGKFLRSTSLDELPELFNVVQGTMSLVGPRPLLMHYLDLYTPDQMRRHAVLPGITGWAQINGRNALSWEEKFSLDLWYVDHHSLGLDIKILFLTSWKTIRREGITQPGHATMEEFKGTNSHNQNNQETF